MANSNVSIANRLFAYIKHNVDINETLTEQYKNSLIFIGDEQQIYAPSMQAYVGIGMTAYTNTLNRINELKTDIDNATAAVKGQVVSKVWSNVSDVMAQSDNAFSLTPTYMVGDITIAGINQYDPEHPDQAKNTIDIYTYNQSTGQFSAQPVSYHIPANDALYNSGAPESGIRVRYKQNVTTDASGNVIRSNNELYIDDAATWAYITNTAASIKNSTKKYVDTELNRVYRDLLGNASAYVPVGFDSVFETVEDGGTTQYLHTSAADDPDYYYKKEVAPSAVSYDGVLDDGTKYVWEQATFNASGEVVATDACEPSPIVNSIPQLYVNDGEYNSTYNMSLTDGINTLKEVAYLLDKLSDGALGTVTYLTYSQYNTATSNGTNTTGYYLVTGANKSNANEPYAYYVNQANPEDLGIKMAYSIAGNKAEIDHLHNHIKNAETGKTTVRSINTRYNSDLGKLTIVNGHRDTTYLNPNTGGEVDDYDNVSYMGDPDVKLNLILTNTYLSINQGKYGSSALTKVDAGFGKIYFGEYLLVNYDEIDTEAAARGDISAYYLDGLTAGFTSLSSAPVLVQPTTADASVAPGLDTIEALKNGQASNPSGRYFFIKTQPGYGRSDFDNVTWIKVSESDLINQVYDSTSEYSQFYYINGGEPQRQLSNGDPITSGPDMMASSQYNTVKDHLYVYKISDTQTTILKPVLDNKNAIATADWVSSYIKQEIDKVNNSQSNFQADIENQINTKLDNLDYEYIYSDFEDKFWNSYSTYYSSSLVPGSNTYKEVYNRLYAQYKDASAIGNESSEINVQYNIVHDTVFPALRTSLANSLRNSYASSAIVNVKQEDGKVSAEARELPTDKVNVNVDVWGEKTSLKAEPLYQTLSAGSSTRTDIADSITAAASVLDAGGQNNGLTIADILYNLSKDVELYIAKNSGTQYIAVRDGETVTNDTLYYVSEQTGLYTELTNQALTGSMANLKAAITAGNHDYVDWRQYYKVAANPRFVELNIPASSSNYNDRTFTFEDVEGDTVTITESAFATSIYYIYAYKLANGTTVSESDVTPVTGENLSVTLRRAASSKKYITAEVNHNDWSNAGEGENTLNITTHITKLEDTSKENTGLADAYDVRTYIDQLFTFVDVSATVTGDILVKRDAFYTLVSYDEWTDPNNKAAYNQTLYAKNTSTNEYAAVTSGSEVTGYYWLNNTYCANPAQASPTEYKVQFNRGGTSDPYTPANNNYYICNEVAKINPLNLTLTLFGSGN